MPDPQREPQKAETQAVGAVVVDRAGRVLLIRRGRPPGRGQWTLPGGRVEPGESNERAVVREVGEETSLRVRVVAPLGVVAIEREGYRYAIHEYLCAPELGELGDGHAGPDGRGGAGGRDPRAGDDAEEVRWVDPADLESLAVLGDARAVIERGLAEARSQKLMGP